MTSLCAQAAHPKHHTLDIQIKVSRNCIYTAAEVRFSKNQPVSWHHFRAFASLHASVQVLLMMPKVQSIAQQIGIPNVQ